MLAPALKDQLRTYLERLTRPVLLVAALDDSDAARSMRELLEEIASLSSLIRIIEQRDGSDRVPSFSIRSPGQDIELAFAGLPMGPHFTSLILALLQVGGHAPREEPELLEQAKGLKGPLSFETYFVQDCQSCPQTVQALNLLAVLNPQVKHIAIDGALFPDEVEQRQVLLVPKIYVNGEFFDSGRMGLRELLEKL
ncbi:MAG: thioredoxin family protein [Burkholderiaceae bacterium]